MNVWPSGLLAPHDQRTVWFADALHRCTLAAMAINRWEWLEGLKQESAIEVCVKYLVQLIADELTNWPPDVALPEPRGSSRFSDLFTDDSTRPPLTAYNEAIKRVRWELARNFDAIDFYERNHHLAKACPARRDQLASEFIQHYILESFFALMERTEYRVKRKDALVGTDLLARRLEVVWFASIARS